MSIGAADDDHGIEAALSVKLGVGVTGHRWRDLQSGDRHHLDQQLDQVLRVISVEMRKAGIERGRLISSLAIGADTQAAQAALAIGYELEVILPARRDVYSRDFDDVEHARETFDNCLEHARSIFELPGTDRPNGTDYERAGHAMLAQCDLLLAVWDGEPARGRGGTEQIVREAVADGIPVIHIDANGALETRLLWAGLDPLGLAHTRIETVARGSIDLLPELIAKVAKGFSKAPSDLTLSEPPQRRQISFAYPLLLAVAGVRRLRRSDFVAPDKKAAEERFLATCIAQDPGFLSFDRAIAAIVAPRFAAADAAAMQYGRLYRHGFVANFTLAAIAVLLALASPASPEEMRPWLTGIEIIAIARILWLTSTGRRENWHRRWIGARFLAERLRCLALSSQLADLDLQRDTAPDEQDTILAETAHRLGLPDALLDRTYINRVRVGLTRLLDEQIAYQHGNAGMMHRLDHRLHRAGTVLFGLTGLSCVALLAYKLVKIVTHSPLLIEMEANVLSTAVLVSAGIPAIGAALYGIRMQGDFSGIASRADTIAADLARLRQAVQAQEGEPDAIAYDELRHVIRRSADLMSSELIGWRVAHGARPLTLPG